MTSRDRADRLLIEALRGKAAPARLQVRGGCMEPLIRNGDWVTVSAIREEPDPGSIVVATTSEGHLVCHRVLHRSEQGFWIAGDRSLETLCHPAEAILGVVRCIERNGTVFRLDTPWVRAMDRMLAGLHLRATRLQRSTSRRLLEVLRRSLQGLRSLASSR